MEYPALQRGLRTRHLNLIALGGIIGSAYFLGSGYLVNQVGPGAFIAYLLGGFISYLTLVCLAELEVAVHERGSFIAYAAKYVSPSWACGVGWSYWVTWVVYIPSECLAGGIIMHHFIPEIPPYIWAFLFGFLVTLMNLMHVRYFGELEFWLSIVKILALIGFSVLALLIYFGLVGTPHEFIGDRYLLKNGGLFPNGLSIVALNMVILLVNFQGSEIIGLSASETEFPEKAIPASVKRVTYRILFLYLVPIFLLCTIFPWQDASLQGSVFGAALSKYGLTWAGVLFNIVIITAALSCSNSGFFATVRALYGLTHHGMGPKAFGELNARGVPAKATWVTIAVIWLMLILSYFFSAHTLYTNLLGISGFTGAICWISICWSQLKFRRIEKKTKADLSYAVPFFPYLTHLGIWLQVLCLVVIAWSPNLRSALYLGIPILVIPMVLYKKFRSKVI